MLNGIFHWFILINFTEWPLEENLDFMKNMCNLKLINIVRQITYNWLFSTFFPENYPSMTTVKESSAILFQFSVTNQKICKTKIMYHSDCSTEENWLGRGKTKNRMIDKKTIPSAEVWEELNLLSASLKMKRSWWLKATEHLRSRIDSFVSGNIGKMRERGIKLTP